MNIDSLIEKLTPDAAERLVTQLLFLGKPWEEANRELSERNTRQAKRLEELENELSLDKLKTAALQNEVQGLADSLKAQVRKFNCPKAGDKLRILVNRSQTNALPGGTPNTPNKGEIVTVSCMSCWTVAGETQPRAAVSVVSSDGAGWFYLLEEVEPA